jgi:hypothetical protein
MLTATVHHVEHTGSSALVGEPSEARRPNNAVDTIEAASTIESIAVANGLDDDNTS